MEGKKYDARRAKVAEVGTYGEHATAAGDLDHLVFVDVQWFGIVSAISSRSSSANSTSPGVRRDIEPQL